MKKVVWDKLDRVDGRVLEDGDVMILETLAVQDVIIPLACCDCGLTHSVLVSWNDDRKSLSLRFFRDDKSTEAARSYFKQFFRTAEAVECADKQEGNISRLMEEHRC